MNSQFKLRLWDKQLNRMFYPGDHYTNVMAMFFDGKGHLECLKIGEAHEEWDIMGGTWHHEMEYHTSDPMQCTGLVDKAGKEIYEGDIVRLIFINKEVQVFTVQWHPQKARFVLIDDTGEDWGFTQQNDIEVLGNVFENPELFTTKALTK